MNMQRSLARLSGLLDRDVTDNLLREVRRRVYADGGPEMHLGRDFFSLAGVRDLFFPGHEDAFDITEIEVAIVESKLRFLGFDFAKRASREQYVRQNPHDPMQRDFAAWRSFERAHPGTFAGMYIFACRKPV